MLGADEVSRNRAVTSHYHTLLLLVIEPARRAYCNDGSCHAPLVTLFSISAVDEGDGLVFLLEFAMMVMVSCKRFLILRNILFASPPSFCILI